MANNEQDTRSHSEVIGKSASISKKKKKQKKEKKKKGFPPHPLYKEKENKKEKEEKEVLAVARARVREKFFSRLKAPNKIRANGGRAAAQFFRRKY